MKDQVFRELTIKIDRIRSVKKVAPRSYEYKDKLFCVNIKTDYGMQINFCEKTLKKAFKSIKRELWL